MQGEIRGICVIGQKWQSNTNITDWGGGVYWAMVYLGAFSRDLQDKKSKSPLFPQGLQMTGAYRSALMTLLSIHEAILMSN